MEILLNFRQILKTFKIEKIVIQKFRKIGGFSKIRISFEESKDIEKIIIFSHFLRFSVIMRKFRAKGLHNFNFLP